MDLLNTNFYDKLTTTTAEELQLYAPVKVIHFEYTVQKTRQQVDTS